MTAYCDLIETDEGWWCPVCKLDPILINAPRNCRPRPEKDMPPVRERLTRYARALKKWHEAGRPRRSDREVAQIYDQHCVPCERFGAGICRDCGCRVSRTGVAILNKIRMATESCPLGKWG